MRSRVFLIVLAAAALVSSGGVHPVNTYTTAAGLAADHINDVLIDSRGLCGSPRPRDFRVSTGTASSPIVCSTTRALYEWSSAGGFHRQAVPLGDGDQIGDIAADPAGRLWLALTRGLVIVENGRIRKHFTIKDGLPGNWIEALLLDSKGRMWAAARGGLAMFTQPAAGDWRVARVFSPDAGLAGADVKALAESSDGSLWVATSLGISRLRWTGDRVQFETLTRAQGLSDRQINALAEDQGGNLWAGTEGAGLIRINRSGFTTFGDTDGLNGDRVMSIFEDHAGELIAITALPHGRALNLFDGARFRTLAPKIYASRLSPTTAGHRRRAASAIALLPAALMRYAGQLESKQDAVVQRFLLWAIVVLFIVLIAVALYRSRSGSHLNVTPDARRAIERAKKRR